MADGASPEPPHESLGPAERDARWTLVVQFAIEAATEEEARSVLSQALAGLDLPLRGPAVIHPRHRSIRDNMWIAVLQPDLTSLPRLDPDTALTRVALLDRRFPEPVRFMPTVNGELEARREWPPDIWFREPRDEVLLHPAVRGAMIYCKQKP